MLGNSLEDESLLCEFVGAPVSGGGAESLVVGPPHIVVEVGAWLFQAGVVVPVYELLLQEPVGGFDHGVVVRVALPRRRSSDVEHVERPVDFRVVEPAAPVRVFLVKSVFRVSSLIFFGFRHEECRPVVCFTGCPSCRT